MMIEAATTTNYDDLMQTTIFQLPSFPYPKKRALHFYQSLEKRKMKIITCSIQSGWIGNTSRRNKFWLKKTEKKNEKEKQNFSI